MLMNLTRLRQFNFEERALATNKLFKERIKLADQDIVNIMFSAFPGKGLLTTFDLHM